MVPNVVGYLKYIENHLILVRVCKSAMVYYRGGQLAASQGLCLGYNLSDFDIKVVSPKIQLDEEDRDVTRFLWNENPDGPEELIQSYRMTRVLFGVSSSPFLLAATIKHHLKRYVEKFPETCEMLNNSLYVDDLVSGRENVEQAFKTSLESVDIFKGACMILRKWQTNSIELRDRWKEIGMDIGQSVESKNSNFGSF
ncbi:uncharacterized protein TNCV_392301 [Trichonephila clavipes]|nr:uncharacterized protein TNCV_392301 [Trichonephila clavipes]